MIAAWVRVLYVRRTDADRWPMLVRVVAAGGVLAVVLAVFGLPPVSLHGPLHFVGVMDPFCGMTRASRLLARGDLAGAWRFNPASYLLAIGAGAVVARTVLGTVTGRWFEVVVVRPRALATVAVVAATMLELNQQLHAARLR